MSQIITREAAKAAGLLTYYTGKPCTHGHLASRYVSTWTCVQCLAERDQHIPRSMTPLSLQTAWKIGPPAHERCRRVKKGAALLLCVAAAYAVRQGAMKLQANDGYQRLVIGGNKNGLTLHHCPWCRADIKGKT